MVCETGCLSCLKKTLEYDEKGLLSSRIVSFTVGDFRFVITRHDECWNIVSPTHGYYGCLSVGENSVITVNGSSSGSLFDSNGEASNTVFGKDFKYFIFQDI